MKDSVPNYIVFIFILHGTLMGHHSYGISGSNKNLFISIFLNSVIVTAEFIGWIMSGSLALLSDAIHNLSDVFALILSFVGQILSQRKPDKTHSFAFKKAEVVIAFVNALFLIVIWIYIIYEAIEKYFTKTIEINSQLMLWVALIGFLGNFISIILLHKEKEENLNKKAAYLHLFFDTISSVMVILTGIILYFYPNFVILDLIISIVISVMIVKSGGEILRESLHILLQWVPDGIDLEEVKKYITHFEWVESAHDLHIWNIDSNDIYLMSHIVVDKSHSLEKIMKDINTWLAKEYDIHHTSLQVVTEKCC